MPSTNGVQTPVRKQIRVPDSLHEQKRRLADLQSDLLRIVGAMGFSRSRLERRDCWDNAARDPNDASLYRPYDKLQTMARDVVRTVTEHGDEVQWRDVRKAVDAFYDSLRRDALEFLGEPEADDVVPLTLDTKREVAQAECATINAISSKTPEDFATAARENGEALTLMEQLQASLRLCSKKRRLRVMT
jgi:hypothetical protein